MVKRKCKIWFYTLIQLLIFLILPSSIFAADSVRYSAHVENIGWMDYVADGQTGGTTGRALQMEALKVEVNGGADEIQYNSHVQNIGWMTPTKNNQVTGTTGQHLHMEAVNMIIVGGVGERCDLYYRAHVADIGWMGWAKNGAPAGTEGGNKQMEAIEIKLVPKGSPAPGSEVNSYINFNDTGAKGPSVNGALQVRGNQLVNQGGQPVQLKGVSTHGLSWFPQYVNQQLFSELRNNWKANVVRLAMYTAEYNGYNTGGDKTQLKNLVKAGVNFATNADLYAIVDWHVLNDRDPNTYKEEAKAFFNEISSTFRNNNNVIYEICNEPNSGISWESIKNYANEVIPVIRANDPDAIIIVGTPTWSQDVDQAVASPLVGHNNIMYALHFYAATHKDDLRNKMISAYNQGLPVFVSEFSICDASGNGGLDLNSAAQWMQAINARQISYVAWSLCNKAESASLINSSCHKTAGFANADLSQTGQWLLQQLSAPPLVGTPEQPTQPDTPSNPSTPGVPSTGTVDYSLTLTNSWNDGNNTYYQYTLTIKNNSQGNVSSWNKDIKFSQNIEVNNSWNCNIKAEGSNLQISNVDYNGTINPGQSVDIGFILKAEPNLTYSL